MDGWMDEWMDGWMERWMDGLKMHVVGFQKNMVKRKKKTRAIN